MAIRFKPRETIEIKPIDLQPKKALGVRLPFASVGSPFILNYTTKDQVKSNLINLLLTNPGERFNEPLFGVGIYDQMFKQEVNAETLKERIKRQTRKRGKIDWRRTIAGENGIISDQGPVYTNFITTVGSNKSANILASIQAFVISEIQSRHGWWIPNIRSRKFEISNVSISKAISRRNLIKQLERNLSTLFSNRAIKLSKWLISYLKNETGASSGSYIFGVQDFHNVWEVMLRSTLINVEHGWNSKLAQPAYGTIKGGISKVKNRGLRTDIIVRHREGYAIIDAKYYAARDASNAPSVGDFAKQILYETVLRAELGSDHEIRNMFVFPSSVDSDGELTDMFMLRKNDVRIKDIPAVECRYLAVSEVMHAYCQKLTRGELNESLGLC